MSPAGLRPLSRWTTKRTFKRIEVRRVLCGSLLNQVELVVHGYQGSIVRPVAARQPLIRWGRYWIFFSLRLMMRTRPGTSAAAKLAMERSSGRLRQPVWRGLRPG